MNNLSLSDAVQERAEKKDGLKAELTMLKAIIRVVVQQWPSGSQTEDVVVFQKCLIAVVGLIANIIDFPNVQEMLQTQEKGKENFSDTLFSVLELDLGESA